MEDKKLLNEKELSTVVGGLVDKNLIPAAFNKAANRFEHLYCDEPHNMESKQIVGKMEHICFRASSNNLSSENDVNGAIQRLEELYLSLVNTNTPAIPSIARDILNELKRNLGL